MRRRISGLWWSRSISFWIRRSSGREMRRRESPGPKRL